MDKLKILINADSDVFIPKFGSEEAACADIRANIQGNGKVLTESAHIHDNVVTIRPGGSYLFDCGFEMAIPKGYEAQVRPRSGFSTKNSALIPNSPGTIDSDYRGRVMIAIHNAGNHVIIVNDEDRIAQIKISKVPEVEYISVEELDETERGKAGFGSTGMA